MSAISSDEIISILKEEIENYEVMSRDQEVGTVVSVGDGIATIYGIDHAMYGEIVTLENGLKGMVQDIKLNEISCILFGDDSGIKQGTKVARWTQARWWNRHFIRSSLPHRLSRQQRLRRCLSSGSAMASGVRLS